MFIGFAKIVPPFYCLSPLGTVKSEQVYVPVQRGEGQSQPVEANGAAAGIAQLDASTLAEVLTIADADTIILLTAAT
jgi:hypothetical protein